jgi:capsular exopolysaccharide synthesis family protein
MAGAVPVVPTLSEESEKPAREGEIVKARSSNAFDITRSDEGSRVERISLLDPNSPAAVSARQLAQQVKRRATLRGVRSIVVTSPLSGDGKTTTSCNLAIALTRLDRSRSVILVEFDLRRPSLRRCLGIETTHGIDDVLDGKSTLDEAVIETNVPGLSVLPVREGRATPEHLLASENLSKLIRSLEERYSIVIIDTPPVLAAADALSVIDVADACLLVVRAGSCPTASVRSAIEHLPADKMLGCCLNFARRSQPAANYESYGTAMIADAKSDQSIEASQ